MINYEKRQKYAELVSKLQDASTQADSGDVYSARPVENCFSSDDDRPGLVTFECALHLKDWKWKPGSSTGRVSIVITAKETIRQEPYSVIHASVNVNYIKVEAAQARLLQSFHFDYHPDQHDHPIFHVQMGRHCIDIQQADREALQIDYQVQPDADVQVIKSARIPTSDITLPSVLVCLAADHIGGDIFNEYLRNVCEIQAKLPLPIIDKLAESFGFGLREVRGSHWFMHTRPRFA